MAETRIPPFSDLAIRDWAGAAVTRTASKMVNCSVRKKNAAGSEKVYLTQRPGIVLLHDASENVEDYRGRGIHYWTETSSEYFVNGDTVYKGSYGTTLGTISSGGMLCTFIELGDYLILLDPENGEGWYIDNLDNLTQIASNFPSTLAYGGAQLDGYLFVMDEDGIIYHSNSDDATTWSALDFIDAERENDGGRALVKLQDDIIALGDETIEFFYNAGNPSGSVLQRRNDVHYNIGCINGASLWENSDIAYFVGVDNRGMLGVYRLLGTNLEKISKADLDGYLTSSRFEEDFKVLGSGFSVAGSGYYVLTVYKEENVTNDYIVTDYVATGYVQSTATGVVPYASFVYEESSGMWHIWESDLEGFGGLQGFPLVGWTKQSSTSDRYGEGIFANGDIVYFSSKPVPYDAADATFYIADDYWDDGYILNVNSGITPITMTLRIGELDFGTNNNKFMRNLELIGPFVDQEINVRWSNGDSETYGTDRTLNMNGRRKLSALGMFNRRYIELEIPSTKTVYIEGIEVEMDEGLH